MSVFLLNKISKLEAKPQNRVESAWQQEFLWFFTIFHHEFRKNKAIAFEVLMVLAVAHVFGFYNPKQLADFLEVPHQQF